MVLVEPQSRFCSIPGGYCIRHFRKHTYLTRGTASPQTHPPFSRRCAPAYPYLTRSVPRGSALVAAVFGAGHRPQIFQPVVCPVMIDVVHLLGPLAGVQHPHELVGLIFNASYAYFEVPVPTFTTSFLAGEALVPSLSRSRIREIAFRPAFPIQNPRARIVSEKLLQALLTDISVFDHDAVPSRWGLAAGRLTGGHFL